MKTLSKRLLRTGMLLIMAGPVLAHEGHGIPGANHWHASDTWGFVGIAAAFAIALWLSRGGKP
ncbi:MAG: hypothetical protein ABJA49_13080 [Betaproteobacteria bacterium]